MCKCPVQKANEECHTNFKRTKSREQVMEALGNFVESNTHIVVSVTFTDFGLLVYFSFFRLLLILCHSLQWGYLRRLKQLRQALETSNFFKTHEVRRVIVLFNIVFDVHCTLILFQKCYIGNAPCIFEPIFCLTLVPAGCR